MKKLLALILTLCIMTVSACFTCAAYAYTIDAKNDVMSGGQGVGFFDTAANSTATAPEGLGGGVCLRPGDDANSTEDEEWVKYLLPSGMTPGTYKVEIEASSTGTAYMNIAINDTEVLEVKHNATGSYSTFAWTTCGNVYLNGLEGTALKISHANGRRIAANSKNVFAVKSIRLTYIDSNVPETLINTEAYYTKDYWNNGANTVFPKGSLTAYYTDFFSPDKLTYDVSFLPDGVYTMILEASTGYTTPRWSVYMNGALTKENIAVPKNGWGVYSDVNMGIIEIEPGENGKKLLSIELKSSDGTQSKSAIRSIKLSKAPDFDFVDFKTNLGEVEITVPRGADVLTAEFSIPVKTVTSVTLAEVGGETFQSEDIDISFLDKKVNVKLLKALKAATDYTLTLKGVTDTYDRAKTFTLPFTTSNTDDNAGGGSFDITEQSYNYADRTYHIEGRILSSAGLGIEGKNIYLHKINKELISEKASEQISADGGTFAIDYVLPESAAEGEYNLKLTADCSVALNEFSIFKLTETECNEILAAFNNKSSADIFTAVDTYGSKIGFDVANIAANVDDADKVYERLANKTQASEYDIGALITDINRAIYTEMLCSSDDKDDVSLLINDREFTKNLELDTEYIDLLTTTEKENMYQAVYDKVASATAVAESDVKTIIHNEINSTLLQRYLINIQIKNVENVSVTEGQIGVVNIILDEATTGIDAEKNINKVELDVTFTGADFLNENVTIEPKEGITSENLTIEEGKIKAVLTVNEGATVNAGDELCKIKITAPTGSNGTYSATVTGRAYVSCDAIDEYVIKSNDYDDKNFTFTISQLVISGGDYDDGPSGGHISSSPAPDDNASKPVTGDIKPEEKPDVKPDVKPAFNDLSSAIWAKEAIESLYKNNIISGKAEGIFAPNDEVTRAEFCKIIVLAFEIPMENVESEFNDVSKDLWYYDYVSAAYKKGIVNGLSDNNFGPDEKLSRQDMACIIDRVVKKTADNKDMNFDDADEISAYAYSAIANLCNSGIINGVGDNKFSPKTFVTRAQAAQIIYRAIGMEG